jgi:uncharacterized protein YyaL (SSP411 family)
MASNLYLLYRYFEISDYNEIYNDLMLSIKPKVISNPAFYSAWAKQLLIQEADQIELVIAGPHSESIRKEIDRHYFPELLLSGGEKRGTLSIFEYKYIEGKTLIYVCRNKQCFEAVESVNQAIAMIKNAED